VTGRGEKRVGGSAGRGRNGSADRRVGVSAWGRNVSAGWGRIGSADRRVGGSAWGSFAEPIAPPLKDRDENDDEDD